MNLDSIDIYNNKEGKRYEVFIDGHVAFVEYILAGNNMTFTHTEVPPELEGQGVGSKLARYVLEEAREKGYKVLPICPFVSAYIRRHPAYQPLVFGYERRKKDR